VKSSYTLKKIEILWKKYNSKKILRRLRGGEWEFMELKGKGIPQLDNATRAEIVSIKKELSFPEFIERYG